MYIDSAALLALEPGGERFQALLIHVIGDVGLGVERISSTIERIIKAGIVKLKDTPPICDEALILHNPAPHVSKVIFQPWHCPSISFNKSVTLRNGIEVSILRQPF